MNLNPHRTWITPLVVGAFALSAVTGVLMFFHWDTGLNKTAHEWLSWAMVIGVVLHVLLNLPAFKRYFKQPVGRWVMGGFVLLLALSFVPLAGAKKDPSFAPPLRALAQAPLPVLAQVVGQPTQVLRAQLAAAGYTANDRQSLQDLVGADLRAQIGLLNRLVQGQTTPPTAP